MSDYKILESSCSHYYGAGGEDYKQEEADAEKRLNQQVIEHIERGYVPTGNLIRDVRESKYTQPIVCTNAFITYKQAVYKKKEE